MVQPLNPDPQLTRFTFRFTSTTGNQKSLEAPPGFEPGMEVLQTSALPLGDGAVSGCLEAPL